MTSWTATGRGRSWWTAVPADDSLTGGPNDDRFTAGLGNDVLIGLGGNDFFDCGADTDRADGGPGVDSLHPNAQCENVVNVP